MRIALVSDTHVPSAMPGLPTELVDRLQACDLILHAGDLECLDVLESLEAVARTVAVHGNVDETPVVRALPRKRLLTLAGRSVGLIHGNQAPETEHTYMRPGYGYDSPAVETFYEYLAGEFPEAEIIVFGHFHVSVVKWWKERLLVNPGSVAPYRDCSSFGILSLDGSHVSAEIATL
jgi:putative phosphoesterase